MYTLNEIQMAENKNLESAMRELSFLSLQAQMPKVLESDENSFYEAYEDFLHWGSESFTYTVGYKLKVRASESEPWIDRGVVKSASSHNSRKCVQDIADWLVLKGSMLKIVSNDDSLARYKARKSKGVGY